jgi:hypothetical protein
MLMARSVWQGHPHSDWWLRFVYLRSRDPLAINSNYYGLDAAEWCPTTDQCARAARLCRGFTEFRALVDEERLPPTMIAGRIPLCMRQYRGIFGTTRIPRRGQDELVQHSASRHCAVLCNGIWYRLFLYARDTVATPLPAAVIEDQLRFIAEDAARPTACGEEERLVAALTSCERDAWATTREAYFRAEGTTAAATLRIIESALFHLVLDAGSGGDASERGKILLHGSGGDRWFDKSVTLVVFADARAGLNVEHSWADAPVVCHLWEYACQREAQNVYDAEGRNLPHDLEGAPQLHRSASRSHARGKVGSIMSHASEKSRASRTAAGAPSTGGAASSPSSSPSSLSSSPSSSRSSSTSSKPASSTLSTSSSPTSSSWSAGPLATMGRMLRAAFASDASSSDMNFQEIDDHGDDEVPRGRTAMPPPGSPPSVSGAIFFYFFYFF